MEADDGVNQIKKKKKKKKIRKKEGEAKDARPGKMQPCHMARARVRRRID